MAGWIPSFIVGLVLWALAFWIVPQLPLPFMHIIMVVMTVLFVLWLLDCLLGVFGWARPWRTYRRP